MSDTTDVTPDGERRAEIVRQAIVGPLDRRRADAARSAPVHVRIEQPGDQVTCRCRSSTVAPSGSGTRSSSSDTSAIWWSRITTRALTMRPPRPSSTVAPRSTSTWPFASPASMRRVAGHVAHAERRRRERRRRRAWRQTRSAIVASDLARNRLGAFPSEQHRRQHDADGADGRAARRAIRRSPAVRRRARSRSSRCREVGRRQQPREALHAFGQDRERHRRSRQEHQREEQQVGDRRRGPDVARGAADEQAQRHERARAAQIDAGERQPRARPSACRTAASPSVIRIDERQEARS